MWHERVCKYLEGKHENVPSDISLIIHVNKHTDRDVSLPLQTWVVSLIFYEQILSINIVVTIL